MVHTVRGCFRSGSAAGREPHCRPDADVPVVLQGQRWAEGTGVVLQQLHQGSICPAVAKPPPFHSASWVGVGIAWGGVGGLLDVCLLAFHWFKSWQDGWRGGQAKSMITKKSLFLYYIYMVYKIYTVHKQELNTDNATNLCNMKGAPFRQGAVHS